MEKTREEAREIIGMALGKASMCWKPRPKGVFDDAMALDTLDEVLNALYGESK